MISFVGAGPGDIELLTVKGQRRLEKADIVIYDRLVNPLLLFHCQQKCRFYYVGKTPYQPSIPQETINHMLVELAGKYQNIVRLKGGDPSLFGRLTEELSSISKAGIAFEIVPGVTAASGAAAYTGIPLTERNSVPSVTFMTANVEKIQSLELPVLTQEQTLCFYMGVRSLKKIIPSLLAQGFKQQTKVAVISWGTYGRQQKVIGCLQTILQQLEGATLKNPAIIIVGALVERQKQFDWFEKLPQTNEKILLISTKRPEMTQLISYTEQGADIWWHQVGENRDQRFDSVSRRYLAEQVFNQIIYVEPQAEELY